jgi:hypothetical protein
LEIPSDNCIRHLPKLSIGSILGFLCWKWKPYPRVVVQVQIGLSIVLYMRSLFLVESCGLRLSSQYVFVRVTPRCFRFAKMCLCQVKSPVKVQPEILDIFILEELHVVYMDRRGGGTFLFMW